MVALWSVSRRGKSPNENGPFYSSRQDCRVPDGFAPFLMLASFQGNRFPNNFIRRCSADDWAISGGKVNAVAGVPGNPGFIILPRMAEAFGKPRMAEWFGNRYLTRNRSRRLERWRWRLRIRTSFTRERVSIRFLQTVATEMESTSRWTAGKTGRMWTGGHAAYWKNPDRSAQSGSGAGAAMATVPGRTKSGSLPFE